MKIAIAVSGGVDSLAALLLLKDAGHEILALHGLFTEPEPSTRLLALAEQLAVPLHCLDLRAQFQKLVVEPSIQAWLVGETPNPCGLCNQKMKFGLLLQAARDLGCDALATGHYTGLTKSQPHLFCSASDVHKDQTYFLSLVNPAALRDLLFPLTHMTKVAVKNYVAQKGISIPVHSESQDICFIPSQIKLKDFLLKSIAELNLPHPMPGPVLLITPNQKPVCLGTHPGLFLFTEGQRRGLGIPFSEGLYVLGREPATNTLLVGTKSCLGITDCSAHLVTLYRDPKEWPKQVLVRIRYRQKPCQAQVCLQNDQLTVHFQTPQFPTAKGQILQVSSAEGLVLAGGIITGQTCLV